MMSFLALNSQVAEASVTMDEMPITTTAKEMAFRQVMAFPFLEDECIGRPGHHAGLDERLRQRGEQFDEARSARRPSSCAETDGRPAPVDCAHPETPQDRVCKIVAA